MQSKISKKIIQTILSIPKGKVCTYGLISKSQGLDHGARLVSRLLHSSTKKYNLPWHRVISSSGRISIKDIDLKNTQINLLKKEGIKVINEKVDLNIYLWIPKQ